MTFSPLASRHQRSHDNQGPARQAPLAVEGPRKGHRDLLSVGWHGLSCLPRPWSNSPSAAALRPLPDFYSSLFLQGR